MSNQKSTMQTAGLLLKYSLVFQCRKLLALSRGCGVPLASGLACDGQTDPEELELLIKLASAVRPPEIIVEIGSFRGRSTVSLALAATTRVMAVDSHEGEAGELHKRVFLLNLLLSGASDKTMYLNMRSADAARVLAAERVGLLFIDGDHSYESTRNDFTSWIDTVALGGVVAFHDSINAHWGTARFVSELDSSGILEKMMTVGSITAFRRK